MWERASVIAVGDEVLTGEVVNTNASWLAKALMAAGSRVNTQWVVGDDIGAVERAVRSALEESDLVVTIGGLGPTPDDLTRLGVARALGRDLFQDPVVAASVRARHGTQPGYEASIAQQSEMVVGAEVLPNSVGTAPGQLLRAGQQAVAMLPGPPAECRAVAAVLLETIRQTTDRRVVRLTWRSYDLTESEMAHHLRPLLNGLHPRAGLYTRPGVVELRLEAEARGMESVPTILVRAAAQARASLPAPLYGPDVPTDAARLIEQLTTRGETLALAESLTGGMLASQLTAIPGASRVVLEANVVYTNSAKTRIGVSAELLTETGAVSERVAAALAEVARTRADATWGIGLTGFAGPDGGNADDPVGTYYCAVAGPKGTTVRRRRSRSNRDTVRQAACETARFMLALTLAE